jgi:ubiquinone/menaquinone biosynthesis C-methylase UbiE
MKPTIKNFRQQSRRLLRNLCMDLRYGGFLGGSKRTSNYDEHGSSDTVNTDYAVMPKLFGGRVKAADVLVDIGCGKGRVINYWLSQGHRSKIVGIDLDDEIAAKTRKRLRRYKNVSIVTGNALDNLPQDGTVFYLYSPFTEQIFSQFKERLWELYQNRGDVMVIYYAPYHIHVFQNDPRWTIEEVKLDMKGLEFNHPIKEHHYLAVIRMKEPAAQSLTETETDKNSVSTAG